MKFTSFAVETIKPLVALGSQAGDRLVVRIGHLEQLSLVRVLPPLAHQYEAIIDALKRGHAEPLNLDHSVGELVAWLQPLCVEDRPATTTRKRWTGEPSRYLELVP